MIRDKSKADVMNSNFQVYDTVQSMIQDETIQPGMLAVTSGFYKLGDGGGATYVIEAGDHKRLADGGSIIELTEEHYYAHLVKPQSVNYRMFGAVGDGVHDDGVQIKLAHQYANTNQIPVVNLSGEFWIKATNEIVVQTNVSWGQTVFHIDESWNSSSEPKFAIRGRKTPEEIVLTHEQKQSLLSKLKPGAQFIPELAAYKNCLVFIADANDQIGVRTSSGRSWDREDFFYVEEHGQISGDIAWVFQDYTSLTAYPCEDNYLVIDGGTFYISGDSPSAERVKLYCYNGFRIQRSRTIIRNQWVGLGEGMGDVSMKPRHGFYTFDRVYDVTLENIRLIPYEKNRPDPNLAVAEGTYGIGGNRMLNCTLRNVTAEGSDIHWGVMGTNLNKNMLIDHCKLNRIDVHYHAWNITILNSTIGTKGISVTGGGQLTIENTTKYGNSFVSFRQDYGAKWDGQIHIRNCRLIPTGNGAVRVLFYPMRDFDHQYPVGFGRSITVDQLLIDYQGVPNNQHPCWLLDIVPFSITSSNTRLFFPHHLEFRNVRVEGRKMGVRLLEIHGPQHYKLDRAAAFDGDQLIDPNCRIVFEQIHLERMEHHSQQNADVHLLLGGPDTEQYTDAQALYPEIHIINCHGFRANFSRSIAEVFVDRSIISREAAGEGSSMRGSISFSGCRFI